MKYFAKYIETEGSMEHTSGLNEAKINDIIDLKERGIFRYVGKSKFKKLELYLCSRDIKIGDTNIVSTTYKNGYRLSYKKDLTFVKVNTSGAAIFKSDKCDMSCHYPLSKAEFPFEGSDMYKAIGKISKEAVWVKESDEFNEEEINRQFYDDSGSSDEQWFNYCPLHTEEDWKGTSDDYKRIQIKCPTCKTFH